MTIIHTIGIPEQYVHDVMSLLIDSDKEFVPPLSSRTGTNQAMFVSENTTRISLQSYFQDLCRQDNLLAIQDGQVVGFLSFQRDVMKPDADLEQPNVYVSTVIVSKKFRHCGLARALYDSLFCDHSEQYVYTRTWSTNQIHIRLLFNLGFYEHLRIVNGRGSGIDTVYYGKKPK